MTELERARAHLREAQECLGSIRRSIGSWGPNYRPGVPNALRTAECCVLAALSWVWQEQEREKAGKLINDYGIPWIREALGAFP